MHELIYLESAVGDIIKKQYPRATIRDASDQIHEERFECDISDEDVSELDFYKFACEEGFIGGCLCFQIRCGMSKKDPMLDELMAWVKTRPLQSQGIQQSNAKIGDDNMKKKELNRCTIPCPYGWKKCCYFCKSALRYAAYRHDILIHNIKGDKDHIHIYFQKNPKLSEAEIAQYLKGISSYLARLNFPCFKLYCDFAFWSSGYYLETVGTNWRIIDNYIQKQGIGS